MSSHLSEEKSESRADLDLFVEDLLEQMQARFADMGHSILGRMDDMGSRIDELEQSIASLLQQAGLDQNGYVNNTTMDTVNSSPIQTKQISLRLPNYSHQSSTKGSASKAPLVVTTTAVSPKNNLPKLPAKYDTPESDSFEGQQNRTLTPARARVTIEI